MRFNLKNPLWETNPAEAKKGFEKELRGFPSVEYVVVKEKLYVRRKEILGETTK